MDPILESGGSLKSCRGEAAQGRFSESMANWFFSTHLGQGSVLRLAVRQSGSIAVGGGEVRLNVGQIVMIR